MYHESVFINCKTLLKLVFGVVTSWWFCWATITNNFPYVKKTGLNPTVMKQERYPWLYFFDIFLQINLVNTIQNLFTKSVLSKIIDLTVCYSLKLILLYRLPDFWSILLFFISCIKNNISWFHSFPTLEFCTKLKC